MQKIVGGEVIDISVIGLGKLGSPMAAVFASNGFRVVGVDVDPNKVNAINARRAPVEETDLQKLIDELPDPNLLQGAFSIPLAVKQTDITFIVAATPSREDGEFSLEYILPICDEIGKAIKEKGKYHIVVVTSTVMPRDTSGPIKRILEFASGKKCGVDFGLCYNPEFIALGSVIHDFQNPDMILIGNDDNSGQTLVEIYRKVCKNNPQVCMMSTVNAELTKISINTYITTKISYANMLARICEQVPGADVDVITDAAGFDSRIGHKYLKGSISYGGPCFPRDNIALSAFAERVDSPAKLAKVVDEFNKDQVEWMAQLVSDQINNGTILVLGLTYKLNTNVRTEAFGTLLVQSLKNKGCKVIAYDPVIHNDKEVLKEFISIADLIVIAMPCQEFKDLTINDWTEGRYKVVIDCWRDFKYLDNVESIKYIPLGIGGKEKSCLRL
jgi:UDPglucose 6-dehydrogenase